ncbi:MAG: ParA family protein [Anaerolineales bacterium]|jgi:chromosome partitioning protein
MYGELALGSHQRKTDVLESQSGLPAGLDLADTETLKEKLERRSTQTSPQKATPRVISVINRKGGVGKTTTAFNLAGALCQKGYQCLIIDLDPMGSLCRSLHIRAGKMALSDLLIGLEGELGQLIRRTRIPNLFVIPGDPNLRTLEMRFGASMSLRHSLRHNLAEVLKWKPFPFVFIDCPPSLGLISGNALIAATEIIIPVDGCPYGMGPLVDTLGIIDLVRKNVNADLKICGLLLNNVDLSTVYDLTVRDVLREQFPELMFQAVIPTSPQSDICSQLGAPVTLHAPASWMAKSYWKLVEEILERGSTIE